MPARPWRIDLLALPESSGLVLYGLHEVLGMTGTLWPLVTGQGESRPLIDVRIVALTEAPLRIAGSVPVIPDAGLAEANDADVVIVGDLALPIDVDPRGRFPEAAAWLQRAHARGGMVCSVCSGALVIAESGLLDGGEATTHWAYADVLRRHYPAVRVAAERVLVPTGAEHRVITAGGASAWTDLVLFLIGRLCGGEEAVRAAKLFLLGDLSQGQLPFTTMMPPRRSDDATVAEAQVWLASHYAAPNPVATMVERTGLPARTFARRFRAATGYAPMDYVQSLRIEEAKQVLETVDTPIDDIAYAVGYEDTAFFRRLFKRRTGVTPGQYRRRFGKLRRPG